MFNNLGVIKEVISDTELLVRNILSNEDIVVKATKEYVSSIKAQLNYGDDEMMIIEYDLKTKVVNENIEE